MRRAALAATLALLLTSCTATATPTSTPVPTNTAAPLPTPAGDLLTEWEGIPVMPGALAGEAKSNGYTFTINATPDEVKGYYDDTLVNLGWMKFMTGKGDKGPAMLIYSYGSTTASILITPQDGDIVRVVLVK